MLARRFEFRFHKNYFDTDEKRTSNKFRNCLYVRTYISREVGGSIPDEVNAFFFNLPKPSGRTRPWGFAQPLREIAGK
jgi:hypothetical protein